MRERPRKWESSLRKEIAMNANRNLKIDFMVNGKHDHFIESKQGKSRKKRATKKGRKA